MDAKALVNVCTAGLGGIVGRVFDDVSEEREKAVLENAPYICVFNHPLNPNFDLASERYPMSPGVVTVEPTHEILGNNVAAFVEENATVKYACWARRILRDEESGRVTGLVYEDEDGVYHQVNASKGVILCTGDFAGNLAMVNYFQDCHRLLQGGDLGWPDIDAKGERTNLGEGLSMAYWIGAKTDTTHACCNDHYGGALGCDPMLFVDGKGERFMNEDVTGEILGEKVNRVAGEVIWQVFDSNYPDQIAHMPVGHRTYWKVVDDYDEIPLGLFLDPIGMITRQEVESWPGLCEPADTLEELAENMGVDPETFKATVGALQRDARPGRRHRLRQARRPPDRGQDASVLCGADGPAGIPDVLRQRVLRRADARDRPEQQRHPRLLRCRHHHGQSLLERLSQHGHGREPRRRSVVWASGRQERGAGHLGF